MIQGMHYLDNLLDALAVHWPDNRIVNIVCHGHSVPAGYFATPFVDTFHAYPHLLHRLIKERFPYAVVNVIVTAVGGEDFERGAQRFDSQALSHAPELVIIDYGLNDRRIGLKNAKDAWRRMTEAALSRDTKVILATPTWDNSYYEKDERWHLLCKHAEQIRGLADEYSVGLADVFRAWEKYVKEDSDLTKLLSHGNHPTGFGHQLASDEIGKYFIAR